MTVVAGKPPAKPPAKRAPRKAAAKKSPARKAAEQQATVTPIRRDIVAQGRNARRHSPNGDEQMALALRRNKVFNLYRAGLTMQQVADQISTELDLPNYTKQRVSDDLAAMRDGLVIKPAKDMLYDDLERLMALQIAVWPEAMKGNTKAVREARAILDQRAKYLGLYSPIRQILVGVDGGEALANLDDPADVYAATLAHLDKLLPKVEKPALGSGA